MSNKNRHSYFIPLLLILILFSVSSMAQVVILPDENLKDAPKNRMIIIDGHMLELAESYVYLLDQFEFLTDDYSKYFTKCDDEAAHNYYKAIKNFNIAIKQGKYFENLKKFNIDLENISIQLDDFEQSLDADSKNSKFKQLFKNFAEDLNVYKDIYKTEVMVQLQEYKNIEDLQLYLINQHCHKTEQNKFELITKIKSKEKELAELQSKLYNFEKKEQTASKSEIIIHIPGQLDDIYAPLSILETLIVEIPDIAIPDFELENFPEPPEIEGVIYDQIGIGIQSKGSQYKRSYCEYWNEKSFKDSSSAIFTATPIYLFNPTGEISVKGWNKNYVLVKSEISITSDTEEKAEKFAQNISVQIYNKDGKLFVNTEIPKLKDPKTKIVDSHISLKVPMKNNFICKSSRGLINISDMKNDIKLKTVNSEIEIDKIKGNIEILNDNGDIEIFNVTGNISVENSFGEIYLTGCSGKLNIENAYNLIELIDCDGDGKIKNSGMVSIVGHNGNLSIKNKKGNTDINMHTGNLQIASAYAAITLFDIRGNVTVNNLNAPIKVDNIVGMLSASNTRSLISISDFQGPLNIANTKGKIILNVPGRLSGDATIIPTESFVDISISENSNFDFMALTEDGMIKTLIPMSITHEGNQSKAIYTFGDGNHKFTINGKQSNINIKEY